MSTYTINCTASPKVVQNLITKFGNELVNSMPVDSRFSASELRIIINAFIEEKFAKKSPAKKAKSPAKEGKSSAKKAKTESKPRLNKTHTVTVLRDGTGEKVKGTNGSFLRFAVEKKTKTVHKVNEGNWTAHSKTLFTKYFTNKCFWPEGSRQPTKKFPLQIGKAVKQTPKKKTVTPKKAAKSKEVVSPKKGAPLQKRKLLLLDELVELAKQYGKASNFTSKQRIQFVEGQTIKEIRSLISHSKKKLREKLATDKKFQKSQDEVKKLADEIKIYDNEFVSVHYSVDTIDNAIKGLKLTLAKHKREKRKKDTKAKKKTHSDLIQELLSGNTIP